MENINTKIEILQKEYDKAKKEYNEENLNYNRYLYNLNKQFLDFLTPILLQSEYKEIGYLDYDNSYIRIEDYYEKPEYIKSTIYIRNKSNDRLDFSLNIKDDVIEINKPSSGYYSKKNNNLYVLLDYLSNVIWENEQTIINLLLDDYKRNKDTILVQQKTSIIYYKTKRELKELKEKKEFNEFLSLLKSKSYIAFLRQTYYNPDRETSNYRKIFIDDIERFCTISNVLKIKNITEKNVIIVDEYGYRSYMGLYSLLSDYKNNHVAFLDTKEQQINDPKIAFYKRDK